MEGKNTKIFLFFFILLTASLVIFCFDKSRVLAGDNDLMITEIMYSPNGTDKGFEWIEIYNSSDSRISIAKGQLGLIDESEERDADGKLKNTCHTFDSALDIGPKEYQIIVDNKTNFINSYPDFLGKILDTVLDLNNSEDAIKLSFDKCTSWKTEMIYSETWGADGNGKTLEKISARGGDSEKENWQESYVLGGTPGEKSSEKKIYPTDIIISELFPNPVSEEEKNEFIEIYNPGSANIDLENWNLEDKGGSVYRFPKIEIEREKYLAVYRSDFKFALNNSGGEEVILKDPNGDVVSKSSYDESAKENFSYASRGNDYFWTSTPTPGAENIITTPEEKKPAEENLSAAEKVYLNEILPNPKGDERLGEFIELVSRESEPVDLYGFMIRDGSKTGKYIFKEHSTIEPAKYFVIYRPQFKIALNNSKESVSLYNPQGKIISSVSYDKSSENASYNFDEKSWRWSKFKTPGVKNRFDSPPRVKLLREKRVYKNLYAKFSVNAHDKETKHLKYIWDFGDGHKSYLKNTSHKYLKTGKHTVKLTVRDESQTVEKVFPLVVKKYPRPKIEITKAVPNPKGLDSLGETVSLKNISGKKVNLLNYKIATGSVKLVNHSIYSDLILDPGEEKIITRVDSKMVLNNKAGKIALLYPDGKVVEEIQYAKEKIDDDEAYVKIDGQWQWIVANKPEENKNDDQNNILADQSNNETADQSVVLGASDEKDSIYANYHPGFIAEDAFIFFSQLYFIKPMREELNYCSANQASSLFVYFLTSVL